MFDKHSVSLEWAGRTLTIETGRMARQADGAVLVTYGDTTVLATAVFQKQAKPGQDFLPLTVNYQEKLLCSGPHSRRLLQARRPADRKGNADLAADRPPDPPAFRGRLQERDPGHSHRDLL